MISIEEAFSLITQTVKPLPIETAALPDLVGRYLIEPVFADVDSPPHDKSVMDGFAIRSGDLAVGSTFEVIETVAAGAVPTKPLGPGQATRIMTGAPVPLNADAVLMVELSEKVGGESDKEQVRFEPDSVDAEKHILRTGANFRVGQKMFDGGHQVRASEIGLLAEVGISSIELPRRPTAAVLPTGDELVDCDLKPGEGQIRNSNGPMIAAMASDLGLKVTDLGVGRDDEEALKEKIELGLEQDLLILSGGVSAGQKDLVPGILRSLGVRQVFHKVTVKPGKPIWFGVREFAGRRTVVFGLPGNPVSSLVGFQLFVTYVARLMAGGPNDIDRPLVAELVADHQTRGNRPTYWPGAWVVDQTSARKVQPLNWSGSSDLLALGRADGLIYFAADQHDHSAGDAVKFYPF
jgi:molybdopterin molybdotransferase